MRFATVAQSPSSQGACRCHVSVNMYRITSGRLVSTSSGSTPASLTSSRESYLARVPVHNSRSSQ